MSGLSQFEKSPETNGLLTKITFQINKLFHSFHRDRPDIPVFTLRPGDIGQVSGVDSLMKATFLTLFAIWDTAPKYIFVIFRAETYKTEPHRRSV